MLVQSRSSSSRFQVVFLTLEGIDGSGKTTQARLLAERLRADDVDVVLTREPGGTALGEAVRDLVLHGGDVSPWAEAALYAASRAQHVDEVIRPALDRGAVVVCDRYLDSSAVYQGVGRGLGLERVLELNLTAVGGLLPDRTFLLRLDPADALARMGSSRDRIEREGETFLALVHDAYDALAARYPDRFVVVDASRDSSEIAREIHGAVRGGS
jgi:dTMP kinase